MGSKKAFTDNYGLYDPQFEHDSCGVGLLANIKGQKSHQIVKDSLKILVRMNHRGARGAEENTGDGAGVLTQIPHKFFRRECEKLNIALPQSADYAVGMFFLPQDEEKRAFCEQTLIQTIGEEGQIFLGWRDVPTDNASLGNSARNSQPFIKQILIAKGDRVADNAHFERKLFVIRRWAKELITRSDKQLAEQFYVASLSSKTIVYKGMLTTEQLGPFYPDLSDDSFESCLALVHSRFSTNTFPNWNRAQPLRYIAHNGEINTLRGNVNWMHAREKRMRSTLFGEDLHKVLHVIDDDTSDSGAFDNSLEMFTLAGRELPHAMMMMIPEPMFDSDAMSDAKRAFYEFHACLMEPWDGPASITFTDGEIVGGVLDRNGLRPSRYCVTKDGLVVMASETGVLEIDPADIVKKGRLQPGKMFLIDTRAGRIIDDAEIKQKVSDAQPYRQWLDENMISINDIPHPPFVHTPDHKTVLERQRAFGYTDEELRMLLAPMFENGAEAIGSMGNDTPLAVLSKKPQLVYNYFKQLFAQVTNPPIDAIREEIVTSTDTTIGPEYNLLEPVPECARQIKLNSFILDNAELLASLTAVYGLLSTSPLRQAGLDLSQFGITWDRYSFASDPFFRQSFNANPKDFSSNILPVPGSHLFTIGAEQITAMPGNLTQIASVFTHSYDHDAALVRNDYQLYLGRSGSTAEVTFWALALAAGMTDEQLVATLLSSPEYQQHSGGSDRTWVQSLYSTLLGRSPAVAEVNGWLQFMAAGASRFQVAWSFATCWESASIAIKADDGRTYLFATAQYLDGVREGNSANDATGSGERLILRFTTGEVVVLGSRLERIEVRLAEGRLWGLKTIA